MGFSVCPICTEDLREGVVSTKCGHIFHELCLSQWLGSGKSECPTCRNHTSKKGVIKVFLNPDPGVELNIEEFEKYKKSNEQLIKTIVSLNDSIVQLKELNEVKDRSYREQLSSTTSLQENLSNLHGKCERLKQQIKNLELKNKNSNNKYAKLNGEFECSQRVTSQLKNSTSILENKHRVLNNDRNSLHQTLQKSEERNSQLNNSISILGKNVDVLKNDKKTMYQTLQKSEERNGQLQKINGQLSEELKNEHSEFLVAKNELKTKLRQVLLKNVSLCTENLLKISKLLELESCFKEMEDKEWKTRLENNQLLDKVHDLEEELHSSNHQLEAIRIKSLYNIFIFVFIAGLFLCIFILAHLPNRYYQKHFPFVVSVRSYISSKLEENFEPLMVDYGIVDLPDPTIEESTSYVRSALNYLCDSLKRW